MSRGASARTLSHTGSQRGPALNLRTVVVSAIAIYYLATIQYSLKNQLRTNGEVILHFSPFLGLNEQKSHSGSQRTTSGQENEVSR